MVIGPLRVSARKTMDGQTKKNNQRQLFVDLKTALRPVISNRYQSVNRHRMACTHVEHQC